MYVIIILIILFILFLWIRSKFRKKKEDNLLMFSGSPGSGKTFNMVKYAKRYLKRSIRFNRKNNLPEPVIYSNFPIRYKVHGKEKFSIPLEFEHLVFKKEIIDNSIVVIDEFSSLITQFDYKQKNVYLFDEFCRMFRHYFGENAHLLVADQCSSNAVLQIRRRFNKVLNCVNTSFYLDGFISICHYRYINISEEIKSVEEVSSSPDTDDSIVRTISLHIPGLIKKIFHIKKDYDSRCYSVRYDSLFKRNNYQSQLKSRYKQFDLLKYDFENNVDYPFTNDLKEVLENEK